MQIESDIQLVMDRLRSVVGTALFAGSAARERQLEDVVPKASAQDKAVYEYIQTSTTQVRTACNELSIPGSLVRNPPMLKLRTIQCNASTAYREHCIHMRGGPGIHTKGLYTV